MLFFYKYNTQFIQLAAKSSQAVVKQMNATFKQALIQRSIKEARAVLDAGIHTVPIQMNIGRFKYSVRLRK